DSTPIRGLDLALGWISHFHAYAWTSTPMRGLWNACELLELLPRIRVDFHAYAWTLNLVGKVRATPRLPGVRLGMDVLALGLRVVDPRIRLCVDRPSWWPRLGLIRGFLGMVCS
ncbi:hypothetical protein PIB30_097594, partial [Stylosanthes scabra]|nr:hypothetical protein [Stylosanthes scabra]